MEQKDTRALRNILGCFATGVAIITARGADNAHIGVTVNSFSSVSLDPPLVLVCVHRRAPSLSVIEESRRHRGVGDGVLSDDSRRDRRRTAKGGGQSGDQEGGFEPVEH